MFRASVCPSSGVQVVCYCIWCSAPGVVAVVLRSRCVVLCTVCKFVSEICRDMIINRNCCFKLVPLVIFIYDAWSQIHQIYKMMFESVNSWLRHLYVQHGNMCGLWLSSISCIFQLDNPEIVLTVHCFPRVLNTWKWYLTSGGFKNPIPTVSEHVPVSSHMSVYSAHGHNVTLLSASYEAPHNIFSL